MAFLADATAAVALIAFAWLIGLWTVATRGLRMVWRLVVRLVGGNYELGPWLVCIHDAGIIIAKDALLRWEWPERETPTRSRAERSADEDRLTRYGGP